MEHEAPSLLAPALTFAATVLGAAGGFFAVWWKGRQDRIARIEAEAREARLGLYRRIASEIQNGHKSDSSEDSKKALAIDIALFASDEVAEVWIAYLDAILEGQLAEDAESASLYIGRLLLAMRRDAGRPTTKLGSIDTLALGVRQGRDVEVSREEALEAGLARPAHEAGATDDTGPSAE